MHCKVVVVVVVKEIKTYEEMLNSEDFRIPDGRE